MNHATHQPTASIGGEPENLLIRASAGTGKTYALSSRFLRLIADGCPPQKILATTFTRKAAGEILDRVLSRLAAAVDGEAERKRLAADLDRPEMTRETCLQLLTALTRNVHQMRISTLDAFFTRLARSYQWRLPLPPGWRVIDQVEDARLRRQAIQTLLEEDADAASRQLVHWMDKGSSSRRISSMMLERVGELYDLYLNTDEAAWTWLPKPAALDDATLETACQEFAAIVVEGKRLEDARAAAWEMICNRQWKKLLSKGIAAKLLAGDSTYYGKPLPSELCAAYQVIIDHAVALEVRTVASQNEGTYKFLERFDTAYRHIKQRQRAVPIGDATRTLAAAIDRGATDLSLHLPLAMDAPIDHLLLDEFQDTSLQQWHVLRPLAARITRSSLHASDSHSDVPIEQPVPAGERSFFCVGDTKQAIYGWRGGLIDIFDNLHRDLEGVTERELSKSYRSSRIVIEAVNRVMSGLKTHGNLQKAEQGVMRFFEQFHPHETAVEKLGHVCLQTAPELREGEDALAASLRAAVDLVARQAGKIGGKTIGVLVRRNKCIGPLIHGLREKGIVASEEGGNPLTDSNAVRAILSLLKLVDHPGDCIARFHLATTPLGAALRYKYEDFDSDEATLKLAQTNRQRLLEAGYGQLVADLADLLRPACSQRERTRLRQFMELATNYQARGSLRTSHFLQYVEATKVDDPLAAQVRVMTIHQAKGLQFDMVVLPDLESKLVGRPPRVASIRDPRTLQIQRVSHWVSEELRSAFPSTVQRMVDASHRESAFENVCALYVGMTRAVSALHLIVSSKGLLTKGLFAPTMSGLVTHALAPDAEIAPDALLYLAMDREDWWHEEARHDEASPVKDPGRSSAESSRPPSAPSQPIILKAPDPINLRGLETATPSSLEGGSGIVLRDRLGLETVGGMQFGTLIHAWFEEIEWLEEGPPSKVRMLEIARQLETGQVDIEQSQQRFAEILRQRDMEQLLTRSEYVAATGPLFPEHLRRGLVGKLAVCEVRNEQRIALRESQQILSGSIDRLVLWKVDQRIVAADIVDFKTDFLPAGDEEFLEDKLAFYRPQLAAYRNAIAQMLRVEADCLLTRLCFVGAGVVRQV